MNEDLKKVFKNTVITIVVIFIYGIIIGQKSVYIASTLGAILSLWNLYSIFKDAETLVYLKEASTKRKMISYTKRMFITGVFLFLMIKVDFKWFVSGTLGLLTVRFNIFLIMLKTQIDNIAKKLKI